MRWVSMKKEPWRYLAAAVSVIYIVYLWTEKDIPGIYGNLPSEQMVPLMVTTVAVTLIKVALIAGGILLVKWLVGKFKK